MITAEAFFSIAPLNWLGLLCAVVGGGIIGIERQVCGKPVGIRTSALICVVAYVFVTVATFPGLRGLTCFPRFLFMLPPSNPIISMI